MVCEHNWHLVEDLTNVNIDNEEVMYRFVCDSCGFVKETKREGWINE